MIAESPACPFCQPSELRLDLILEFGAPATREEFAADLGRDHEPWRDGQTKVASHDCKPGSFSAEHERRIRPMGQWVIEGQHRRGSDHHGNFTMVTVPASP